MSTLKKRITQVKKDISDQEDLIYDLNKELEALERAGKTKGDDYIDLLEELEAAEEDLDLLELKYSKLRKRN